MIDLLYVASVSKLLVASSSFFPILQLFSLHSATHHNVFKSYSNHFPLFLCYLSIFYVTPHSLTSALIYFFLLFSLFSLCSQIPQDFSDISSPVAMPRGIHLNETQKDRIYSGVCKEHTDEQIY